MDTSAYTKKFKRLIVTPTSEYTLLHILNEERPSENQVSSMLKDVSEALYFLHSNGHIYGDLRLQSILRYHGRIRLADLGSVQKIYSEDSKAYFGYRYNAGNLV